MYQHEGHKGHKGHKEHKGDLFVYLMSFVGLFIRVRRSARMRGLFSMRGARGNEARGRQHPAGLGLFLCTALILGWGLWTASPTAAQPPVPHDVEEGDTSYEDCVSCHRTGTDDAPLLAADHIRHENTDCRVCHATTGMIEAPRVSHPILGWEDCRGCHDRWYGETVEIPNLADSDYDHAIYEGNTCVSCHAVSTAYYRDMPVISCGVCHPDSVAAETVHNGPRYWVDCVDCHEAAGNYPHDLARMPTRDEDCTACHNEEEGHWTSDRPDERFDLAEHIAEGEPHAEVDCTACHLQTATVERDPETGRIHVVLPEMEEGVPPDTPELALVVKEVDCQRCHFRDNHLLAPAAELPPRSIFCMACHDAAPVVQDALSWVGVGFFGLGMVLTASVWLRGSVGGRHGERLPRRLGRLGYAVLDLLTTPRLFVLLWSLVVDGLLHRKLFRKSKIQWLTHACMFFGMTARFGLGVITWLAAWIAPTAPLTMALVGKNVPAVALLYDLLGVAVIFGAVLALLRRYVLRDPQLLTSQQDAVAIGLLGAIFVMGFVVEGMRLQVTAVRPELAAFSIVGLLFSRVLELFAVDWGVVYGWVWYGHAVLVIAFFAYLPFGKFIHILVSPFVAAFNSALESKGA